METVLRPEEVRISVKVYSDEDGVIIAECPALPGCVSQGHTLVEALANIKDAIELVILTRADLGRPVNLRELRAPADHEVPIDAIAAAAVEGYREGL
jgi:predicted RNase H-like HicB family nuclease